ncbi:hypothetical protein NDU88_006036 [Pleurodeles waltl]|uniref:Uncharacterized protein n=1 Tax=Pleurodeles waltl TaxID=8319 RepID=A0AAV7WC90_PLEWA|nr:hypothetical protein NDU88_006036 [Pleurodeles waltl]
MVTVDMRTQEQAPTLGPSKHVHWLGQYSQMVSVAVEAKGSPEHWEARLFKGTYTQDMGVGKEDNDIRLGADKQDGTLRQPGKKNTQADIQRPLLKKNLGNWILQLPNLLDDWPQQSIQLMRQAAEEEQGSWSAFSAAIKHEDVMPAEKAI